jgi:hypothetical protein
MKNSFSRIFMFIVLFLGTIGQAPAKEAQEASTVEPRVEGVLRQMSDLLAESSSFAFKAEEIIDEVLDSGFKAELSHTRTIALRRPGGVVTNVDGDTAHRSAWFDGKTVTVLDRQHNRYAVVDTPNDIDEMLDYVAEAFDIVFPLADILHSDVYESLTAGAEYTSYLGIHQVEDIPCHHLAFANEWLEWQLWVAAEGEPLPRKLVITYIDEPGEPKYTARFLSWNLSPKLEDDLFVFKAPEGAHKMEAWSFARSVDSAQEKKP